MEVRAGGGQDVHRLGERVLPLSRTVVTGSLTVAASLLLAAPASALTEARITDVSCSGLRVVQTGLPPRVLFQVEAIDAATGKPLRELRARSSARGALSVRVSVPLAGVHRLHAEVAKAGDPNAEYGEADVDLDRFCHVTGSEPVPRPSPSQPGSGSSQAAAAGTSGDNGGGSGPVVATVVSAAVAAGVVGGAFAARRLRRRPRTAP